MQAVVTGGAGFIGSHIAEALLGAGHKVAIIDDLSRGKRENVPAGAELFVVGITDNAVAEVINKIRPDVIFHLAAQMDVRASVADPSFDSHVNVTGTVKLLTAAVAAGTKTFIFASSGGAIYGEQDVFPAPETHRVAPESPYGLAKFCGEQYMDYFSRKMGLRTVALRYANVYGPRQDPHGEAGVVAIFSKKMLSGETATIFGDGGQTRDYVCVHDVVRANMAAMENPNARGAYNIGTGIETDVNELAALIAKAAGHAGKPQYAAGKPGEQRRSVVACQRAEKELGWKPRVALADGLKLTVDWFAKQA